MGSATPVAGQVQFNQVIVKTVEKILNTNDMEEGVQLEDPSVTTLKKNTQDIGCQYAEDEHEGTPSTPNQKREQTQLKRKKSLACGAGLV